MLPRAQQAWGGEGNVVGGDGDWQGPGALNHPHCQRIGTPKYLQDTGPSSQDIPGIVWVTSVGKFRSLESGKVSMHLEETIRTQVKDTAVTDLSIPGLQISREDGGSSATVRGPVKWLRRLWLLQVFDENIWQQLEGKGPLE